MSKHRRAANVDTNQGEIVKTLRSIPGVTVELGHDDIIVGYQGRTYWYEIKSPDKVLKSTGRVSEKSIKDSQIKLLLNYTGHYKIIWTVKQILDEVLHGIVDPNTIPTPRQTYSWRSRK